MGARGGRGDAAGASAAPAPARALDGLDAASRWAIVAVMAVMVAIVSVQVFLRYVFNESLDWADELSRLAFVWAIFLAIPHALRRGAHVGIDLVVARLPVATRSIVFRVSAALAAVLMAVATWKAVVVAADTWDQLMPTINASAGWFYVAVAVGGAHSVLHLVGLIVHGTYADEPRREAAAR